MFGGCGAKRGSSITIIRIKHHSTMTEFSHMIIQSGNHVGIQTMVINRNTFVDRHADPLLSIVYIISIVFVRFTSCKVNKRNINFFAKVPRNIKILTPNTTKNVFYF